MNAAPKQTGAALQRDAASDPKTANPPPGGRLASTNSPTAVDVQQHQFRAAWVSRRFLLRPSMASAVAALAFQTVEAR